MDLPSISHWHRWVAPVASALLLLAGCRGDAPKATPAQAQPQAQAPKSVPEASVAEKVLETTGVVLATATPLDATKFAKTTAKTQERFTSADPALEILLLGYASPDAAAVALPNVASWANRSNVMHKAEAMAEGDYVLLVGLESGGEPTDETKTVVNKLLDTFVANATRW